MASNLHTATQSPSPKQPYWQSVSPLYIKDEMTQDFGP